MNKVVLGNGQPRCLKWGGAWWEKTGHEFEKIQASEMVEGHKCSASKFILCPLGSGKLTKVSFSGEILPDLCFRTNTKERIH